jgi:hypothetical protein
LPPDGPKDLISYYEALAICSAIRLGIKYGTKHIAIYSDNTNSVDMFSSLYAKPEYNKILISAIDITNEIYYIPGVDNIIADPLSCFRNALALLLAPKLVIKPFQPPQDALGVSKK